MLKKKGKPEDQTGESDVLGPFFDQLVDAVRAEGVPSEFVHMLARLKSTLVSSKVTKMSAKDFTLEEAVDAFGLQFNEELMPPMQQSQRSRWRIEDMPETKEFKLTPCLRKAFQYSQVSVHSWLTIWLEQNHWL
jgi:hypothetical protein